MINSGKVDLCLENKDFKGLESHYQSDNNTFFYYIITKFQAQESQYPFVKEIFNTLGISFSLADNNAAGQNIVVEALQNHKYSKIPLYLYLSKNPASELTGFSAELLEKIFFGVVMKVDSNTENSKEYVKATMLLIENGLDLNVTIHGDPLIFFFPGKVSSISFLEALEKMGVDLNEKEPDENRSLLHRAAEKGDLDLIDWLVKDKAVDIEIGDEDRVTPLGAAAESLNIPSIKHLLSLGASKKSQDKWGFFALQQIAISMSYGEPKVDDLLEGISLLSDKDNQIDSNLLLDKLAAEQTPAIKEMLSFRFRVFEWLKQYQISESDSIPLIFKAIIEDSLDESLRKFSSIVDQVNLEWNGLSPLLLSLALRKEVAFRRMVELGADLNIKDSEGKTVMHYAPLMNSADILEFLKKQGADHDITFSDFRTPNDQILSHLDFNNATYFVRNHTVQDHLYGLFQLGNATANYTLDYRYTNIAIPVAEHFWDAWYFALGRKMMSEFSDIRVHVVHHDQATEDLLIQFDGFLLQGSASPGYPDQEFNISGFGLDQNIDALYQKTLAVSAKHFIPVMGSCAGNQHIALYNGMSVKKVKGYSGSVNHTAYPVKGGMTYFMSLSTQEQHDVLFNQKNIDVSYKVVTAHGYAVSEKSKSETAKISAYSEENIVEGVGNSHMFGFQFHPEVSYLFSDGTEGANRQSLIYKNFYRFAAQHNTWKNFGITNGLAQNTTMFAKDNANKLLFQKFSDAATFHEESGADVCEFAPSGEDSFDLPSPSLGLINDQADTLD